MPHAHPLVPPIPFLLVLVFAALVAAQVWAVPGMLPELADPSLEQTLVREAMRWAAVLGLVCVQVVVVCTGKLLTLVRTDCIFSARSLPWVNAIVAAMAIGWLMVLGAFVTSYYFIIDGVSDDPGPPVLLLVLLLVGAVVGLLMVVMRALLQQATTLRTDMEAVI